MISPPSRAAGLRAAVARFKPESVPMLPCPGLPTSAVATPTGVVHHPAAARQDVLAAALTWSLVRDGVPFVPGEVTLQAAAMLAERGG